MRSIGSRRCTGGLLLLLSAGLEPLAAQVKACSLLSRAEAAQLLAKPAIATSKVVSDDEQDCSYLAAGFDLHTEVLKSVSGWSASMKNMIKQGRAEAVSGIGEEAAFTKDGNGDYLVVARKGNRIVTVTIYASEGSAAELKPKLIALTRAAAARLP